MDSAQNLYSAGAFIQAGIDATFTSRLGDVRDVEVNFTPAAPPPKPDKQRSQTKTSARWCALVLIQGAMTSMGCV